MARDLAAFLVPIGVVGAMLAVICAIVAGVAIARGAGGLSGGAVGVWIPFALLSFTASFANEWWPLIASGAALAVMLVLGGIVRGIVSAVGHRPPRLPRQPKGEVVPAAVTKTSAPAAPTGAVAVVS